MIYLAKITVTAILVFLLLVVFGFVMGEINEAASEETLESRVTQLEKQVQDLEERLTLSEAAGCFNEGLVSIMLGVPPPGTLEQCLSIRPRRLEWWHEQEESTPTPEG